MSPEQLSEFAPRHEELTLVESLPEDKDSIPVVYNAMAEDFDATLNSYDKGMPEEWYQPSADDWTMSDQISISNSGSGGCEFCCTLLNRYLDSAVILKSE